MAVLMMLVTLGLLSFVASFCLFFISTPNSLVINLFSFAPFEIILLKILGYLKNLMAKFRFDFFCHACFIG
jgi:hypothetical protein